MAENATATDTSATAGPVYVDAAMLSAVHAASRDKLDRNNMRALHITKNEAVATNGTMLIRVSAPESLRAPDETLPVTLHKDAVPVLKGMMKQNKGVPVQVVGDALMEGKPATVTCGESLATVTTAEGTFPQYEKADNENEREPSIGFNFIDMETACKALREWSRASGVDVKGARLMLYSGKEEPERHPFAIEARAADGRTIRVVMMPMRI